MKSFVTTLLVALALVSAAPARAQVFGQFTGAEPLPPDGHLFGGYLHTSGNELGLLGQLRLSFYPGIDFGFQGGFIRRDLGIGDRTTVQLGADLKGRIKKATEERPLVLSLGGSIAVETGDDLSVLTISPTLVGSRAFGSINPYARIGLAIARTSIDDEDENDFTFPLRVGSEFSVSGGLLLVVELQANMSDSLNDDVALVIGANFPF